MTTFGPPPPLTQGSLLDLLRRNLEDHWIGGLLEDPTSLGLFLGWIEDCLRVQAAGDEDLDVQGYILSALGSAPATSVLRLQRPSGAGGTIPVNMRVRDDRGMIWVPTEAFDYAASGGQQTIDVPIQTQRVGYWLNTFEPLTYVFLDAPPDPNWVILASPSAASGGRSPYLDLHGGERRVPRASGETDDTYRHRMLLLLNKVSPQAIADVATQVLDGYPLTAVFAERIVRDGLRVVFEPFFDKAMPTLQGAWHLPPLFCDSAVAPFLGDTARAFLDDTHGGWVRSGRDASAWFDVFLSSIIDPNEPSFFLDAPQPIPFAGPGPWVPGDSFMEASAVPAPDVTAFFDVPSDATVKDAPVAALADELDRRRAGGVPFIIYVGPPFDVHDLNHPKAQDQIGAWTVEGTQSPATSLEALGRFNADDGYIESSTGAGSGSASVANDYLATIPALTESPVTVSHVVLRAWVRCPSPGLIPPSPSFGFVIRPSGGAAVRCRTPDVGGFPLTVDHDDWRLYTVILERNPVTLASWVPGDVDNGVGFGVANMSAFATAPLQVSELTLDLVMSYG